MASVKPSSSSAVTSGLQARLGAGHRHGADHGAEHQPGRRLVLARALRPGQPAAAHQPAIDRNRIRPIDGDGGFRLRVRCERIGQRRHAGIERAPRLRQRLVRLQHHGEFGKIEAPDIDQRAGALLGRDRLSHARRRRPTSRRRTSVNGGGSVSSVASGVLPACSSGIAPRCYFLFRIPIIIASRGPEAQSRGRGD